MNVKKAKKLDSGGFAKGFGWIDIFPTFVH
jgi:hypothetical protein